MMRYYLPLVWIAFASVLGRSGGMFHRERVLNKVERRASWVYAIIVIAPIILMAAFRSNYFGDTFAYLRGFQSIPSGFSGKIQYIRENTKDRGFYAFSALMSAFFGQHFRYFFLAIAAIQGLCLAKTYRKYSEDFWFSIFVFIASTDIYSWMYNGIRQFMAVAITFSAAGMIFRKKYINAIIMIIFASIFHQSALMMIPIVFITQGKPWNWKTLLVIVGSVFVMSASGLFTNMLDVALQDTQYRNMVSDWTQWQDDGTNPLRVLVYSIPTILSLFCRKKIIKSQDRAVQVACNMGIVSTALYLVSMVTSGIFMGRLPIYCSLYANGILLPWELKHVYGKGIRTLAILCYVLFYFIQMRFAWGIY